MNKLTLQALALSGILAVSGLPAFAADIAAPATPAPNASVSTDTKANVGTSVDNKAKTSLDKNKTATEKKVDKTGKNTKSKVHQQTAAKPATPAVPSVGSSAGANASVGNTGVNASTGVNVQH
jgi:hypothetical protein